MRIGRTCTSDCPVFPINDSPLRDRPPRPDIPMLTRYFHIESISFLFCLDLKQKPLISVLRR